MQVHLLSCGECTRNLNCSCRVDSIRAIDAIQSCKPLLVCLATEQLEAVEDEAVEDKVEFE